MQVLPRDPGVVLYVLEYIYSTRVSRVGVLLLPLYYYYYIPVALGAL